MQYPILSKKFFVDYEYSGIQWTYSIPGPLIASYDMPGIQWTYSISFELFRKRCKFLWCAFLWCIFLWLPTQVSQWPRTIHKPYDLRVEIKHEIRIPDLFLNYMSTDLCSSSRPSLVIRLLVYLTIHNVQIFRLIICLINNRQQGKVYICSHQNQKKSIFNTHHLMSTNVVYICAMMYRDIFLYIMKDSRICKCVLYRWSDRVALFSNTAR